MEQTDYQQLMTQARAGDAAAVERLMDECRRRLKEMLTDALAARLGSDWDPSDAVQESLLEAHAGLRSFRGDQPEALWAWLRTILEHNVADRLKYQHRQKRNGGTQRSLEWTDQQGQSLKQQLIAEQSSVSAQAVFKERLHQLDCLIDELPEPQACVFRMRHIQGLSLDEIAARTGKTRAAIAGLLIRATRRVDRFVEQKDRG